MVRKLILAGMVLVLVGCQPAQQASTAVPTPAKTEETIIYLPGIDAPGATAQPAATAAPMKTQALPSPTSLPTQAAPTTAPTQAPASVGPDQFPEGYNPLTGLQVKDPSLLAYPPALVSVSNFPLTARPQAGLSFAPYVFETYIGYGMTRFLAMFYGDFPSAADAAVGGSSGAQEFKIGPIRSGRLPYERIRNLYSGFLVMASASPEVNFVINESVDVFGSDSDNINSAMIDVTKLEDIAAARAKTAKSINLTGNEFAAAAPEGGKPANQLRMFYNYLNQAEWRYDAASGKYLRWQDQAEVSREFLPATDRLTGQQLSADNVIVLFAPHSVLNSAGSLIDINLFFTENKAYLLRDGQIYPIHWNTYAGDYEKQTGSLRPIRFTDTEGSPFPLKPGNTWVQVVDTGAGFSQPEPGVWRARFYGYYNYNP